MKLLATSRPLMMQFTKGRKTRGKRIAAELDGRERYAEPIQSQQISTAWYNGNQYPEMDPQVNGTLYEGRHSQNSPGAHTQGAVSGIKSIAAVFGLVVVLALVILASVYGSGYSSGSQV